MIHLSSSETGSDNAEKRSSRQKINELNIFNDSKIIFYFFSILILFSYFEFKFLFFVIYLIALPLYLS